MRQWAGSSASDVQALYLAPEHRRALGSMVREYLFLIAEKKALRAEIREATRHMRQERFARVTSVPGVGETVASSFLAELFSPERFNRPEEVTSYLGLAPVVTQSGGGPRRASIRPVGPQRLRSMLVEAAWQWVWRDSEARAIYNQHLAKFGVSQKAICAIARKLAIRLWRLAVEPSPASMGDAARAVRSA